MVNKDGFASSNLSTLRYSATNESLDAIMAGLSLSPSDTVAAICGSGDQVFAMLESGVKVVAVDNDPNQIAFARWRASVLEKGDSDLFLNLDERNPLGLPCYTPNMCYRVSNYFLKEGRLERIRGNLGNLSLVVVSDFLDCCTLEAQFTRAYLSNIFYDLDPFHSRKYLLSVAKYLTLQGLIYVASFTSESPYVRERDAVLPRWLKVDDEQTSVARTHENGRCWVPSVYQKVSVT